MYKICSGMIEEWNMDHPKSCCSDWEPEIRLLNFYKSEAKESWYKVAATIKDNKPFKFCPWCGRNLNSSKAVYDPNMKMPPKEIFEAAKLVENYFGENHMGDWEFMGLRNRFPKS